MEIGAHRELQSRMADLIDLNGCSNGVPGCWIGGDAWPASVARHGIRPDRRLALTSSLRPFTYNCSSPCIPRRIDRTACVYTSEGALPCRNSLVSSPSAFCFRLQLPPLLFSADPLTCRTPFTFGPSAADQFSLSYPRAGSSMTRSFRRRARRVSALAGSRHSRRAEHTSRTCERQRRALRAGPIRLLCVFPTATDIPYSSR